MDEKYQPTFTKLFKPLSNTTLDLIKSALSVTDMHYGDAAKAEKLGLDQFLKTNGTDDDLLITIKWRDYMYVKLKQIQQAKVNLSGFIHRTPLLCSELFSNLSGIKIYLKPENFQKTGSFKIRGPYNKLCNLNAEERESGVIAFSAGNHGAGLAYAAQRLNVRSTIVMPENPVPIKKIPFYNMEQTLSNMEVVLKQDMKKH